MEPKEGQLVHGWKYYQGNLVDFFGPYAPIGSGLPGPIKHGVRCSFETAGALYRGTVQVDGVVPILEGKFVEAEIEKARKEAQDGASAWLQDVMQQGRSDEREEMRAKLENLRSYVPDQSHDWCEGYKIAVSDMIGSLGIRSRGEQEPCPCYTQSPRGDHGPVCGCSCHRKRPGKIARLETMSSDSVAMKQKINELIDDRNARLG
jgi:hypothetical protein